MLEDTLKAVEAYDWGQSRAPLLELDREIRKVLGHPALLARLEDEFAEILRSNASSGAKRFICTRLGVIGTDRSVPVLLRLLAHERSADMARFALERIPGPAVSKALRDALADATSQHKVGIINSISARRDADAVEMLATLLDDDDAGVSAAAAAALGEIGTPAAARALAERRQQATGKAPPIVLHACLECAERLIDDGQADVAAAIYREISADAMPQTFRRAAERGLERMREEG